MVFVCLFHLYFVFCFSCEIKGRLQSGKGPARKDPKYEAKPQSLWLKPGLYEVKKIVADCLPQRVMVIENFIQFVKCLKTSKVAMQF